MNLALHSARTRPIVDESAHARLLARARFLDRADYALVRAALDQSLTRRHIAQLLNIPEGTLTRRINRLLARLYDPTVVTLIEHGAALREEVRQMALEHLLQGKTIAQIVDLHRVSARQVTAALQFARGWARGINSRKNG